MRPTGDGTGGDLAHIWLLPAEEQVDEQPADMVAAVGERSNFKKIPMHTQDHGDA